MGNISTICESVYALGWWVLLNAANNLKAVVNYAKLLNDLRKKEVVVGLPKGSADSTVIEYAAHHEYGAPEAGISKRSFLRDPFDDERGNVIAFMNKLVKVDTAMDADTIYKQAGEMAKGIVIKTFRSNGNGRWDPLKESTIAAKGSSAPLIDKGQLFQSITYEVRNAT